jgi:carbon storage regulator
MLVLTRRVGESIFIGEGIKITVVRIVGNKVRLGLSAPASCHVWRAELAERDAVQGNIEEPASGSREVS